MPRIELADPNPTALGAAVREMLDAASWLKPEEPGHT
jgi:hypothetical protein